MACRLLLTVWLFGPNPLDSESRRLSDATSGNGRRGAALKKGRRVVVYGERAVLYGELAKGKSHERNQAIWDSEQPNQPAKAGTGAADARAPSEGGASAALQDGKEAALS